MTFFFHTMKVMHISENFIIWIKLLFENATAVVNFNAYPGNNFKIERGVRQRCPLAPYLYFIVGEILNHIIKMAVAEGRLRKIYLAGEIKQH